MKCAASLCNKAVLKKNITRFAPVWVLYTAVLLMFVILVFGEDSYIWFAESVAGSLGIMAVFNLFYAFICAQVLVGDLYNSRMCNALHALPLRRESWFVTNAVTGLLFSLVPNAVLMLLGILLSGELWMVPLLWLGVATLQYIFFFGVALLASHLVANRFAMALVYVIFNGFSLIVFWLMHSIYEPLLYGMKLDENIFYLLCPVAKMAQFSGEYIQVDIRYEDGFIVSTGWELGQGWGYLTICAALGIASGIAALLCYRKRQLEVAGDFMSVKKLGPVFLILYTLCGGACCQGFFDLFMGEGSVIYLLLGMGIGFFTGLMLLERTVRVFRGKTWLGFGAVLLSMLLSIVLVRIDPIGITRWMPKEEQVQSVQIYTESYRFEDTGIVLTEPEDIANVLQIHRLGITDRNQNTNGKPDTVVWLDYTLRSGAKRTRNYVIDVDTPEGQLIRKYMGTPEAVLGRLYTEAEKYRLTEGEIMGAVDAYGDYVVFTREQDLRSLKEAVIADCQAGSLVVGNRFDDEDSEIFWIRFEAIGEDDVYFYWEVRASDNCRNLMRWMYDRGMKLEKYK